MPRRAPCLHKRARRAIRPVLRRGHPPQSKARILPGGLCAGARTGRSQGGGPRRSCVRRRDGRLLPHRVEPPPPPPRVAAGVPGPRQQRKDRRRALWGTRSAPRLACGQARRSDTRRRLQRASWHALKKVRLMPAQRTRQGTAERSRTPRPGSPPQLPPARPWTRQVVRGSGAGRAPGAAVAPSAGANLAWLSFLAPACSLRPPDRLRRAHRGATAVALASNTAWAAIATTPRPRASSRWRHRGAGHHSGNGIARRLHATARGPPVLTPRLASDRVQGGSRRRRGGCHSESPTRVCSLASLAAARKPTARSDSRRSQLRNRAAPAPPHHGRVAGRGSEAQQPSRAAETHGTQPWQA